MSIIKHIVNTPWKAFCEVRMLLLKPFTYIYLKIWRIDIGGGFKFYGLPKIYRRNNSKIIIGKRFENRNWWWSNPLGINHPTIICTWTGGAEIVIGEDVGISGGSIVASKGITIGNGTIIGANTTIIDTDFHPTSSHKRRYDKKNIRSAPVRIGSNVFIGMNCVILKGVTIKDNAIIPAGSVIRKDI